MIKFPSGQQLVDWFVWGAMARLGWYVIAPLTDFITKTSGGIFHG